jgi:hypothetical protein
MTGELSIAVAAQSLTLSRAHVAAVLSDAVDARWGHDDNPAGYSMRALAKLLQPCLASKARTYLLRRSTAHLPCSTQSSDEDSLAKVYQQRFHICRRPAR